MNTGLSSHVVKSVKYKRFLILDYQQAHFGKFKTKNVDMDSVYPSNVHGAPTKTNPPIIRNGRYI